MILYNAKQEVSKYGFQQQVIIGLGVSSGINFTRTLSINTSIHFSLIRNLEGYKRNRKAIKIAIYKSSNGVQMRRDTCTENQCLELNSDKNENKECLKVGCFLKNKQLQTESSLRFLNVPRVYFLKLGKY